jgi:hypothetical protein
MDFASDHVLVADIMKPDAAYGYLATAALRGGVLHWHQRERLHRCLALAFYIDLGNAAMRTAYSSARCGRRPSAATPPPCAPRSRATSAPAASTRTP